MFPICLFLIKIKIIHMKYKDKYKKKTTKVSILLKYFNFFHKLTSTSELNLKSRHLYIWL